MDAKEALSWVKDNLDYDRESGHLLWKTDRANGKIKAGSIAGSCMVEGYRQIRIKGKWYKCHRLVWLIETGHWPNDQIDHINRNGFDNRIENLRDVNNYQNCLNRSKISASGVVGVYYDKKNRNWMTGSYKGGVYKNLGRYPTREAAYRAYRDFNKDRLIDS